MTDVTCLREPVNTGVRTLLQVAFVEMAHAADAKLVVLAHELQRAERGRIKRDVFDRRSQAVVWDVEVNQCAAHEDSGGVDLLIESVLAIDEQHLESLPGEQASTLKPGKSRT